MYLLAEYFLSILHKQHQKDLVKKQMPLGAGLNLEQLCAFGAHKWQ